MVKFSLEERGGPVDGESSGRKLKRNRELVCDSDGDENDQDRIFDEFFRADEPAGGIDEAENRERVEDNISASKRTADGSISLFLEDSEVLDCTICYDSLKIPVFQCENGHIACSSCCTKIKNKCPSCSFPIGYNRCRAIEKVIEAVKVLCQNSIYGCNARLNFNGRKYHEDKCMHTPCTCPINSCSFIGSSQQLSRHCSARHSAFLKRFQYNLLLHLSLDKDCKIIILQEERDGDLFILENCTETSGNVITVKSIGPVLSKGVLTYDLLARQDIKTLNLHSFMESHNAKVGATSCFLLVPHAFYNCNGQLKMEISIWNSKY